MKTTLETYEPWLRDCIRKRFPELEPMILAAINAYDLILQKQSITSQWLEPIVAAASSSRRPLCETVTPFLGRLTGLYVEARQAVMQMAQDPRSHVRFNAILCLDEKTPRPFSLELIRKSLLDKSSNVRLKAADWAGRLRTREVVPELAEALAKKGNAKAKDTIEFELKLLRDGYILEPGPDDGFNITTFCSNGIAGRWIRRSEIERRGIQAILDELAARP